METMDRQAQLSGIIEERLRSEQDTFGARFNSPVGTRTRHFVCDDLLPADISLEIYAAFPPDLQDFHRLKSFRERKSTSTRMDRYKPILRDISFAIQSPGVISIVGDITGMKGLEADSSLYAGGLSMMAKGDFLNPHIDNSHDAKRSRYRRLNLLYYASPNWTLENGGNLELWDEHVKIPATIVSKFNRLVVMETNKTSWHSVSSVRANQPRCCVSSYFFSEHSPDDTEYFHVTSFDGRPEEPIKRFVSKADATLRNVAGRVLKAGRGKDRIYQGKE